MAKKTSKKKTPAKSKKRSAAPATLAATDYFPSSAVPEIPDYPTYVPEVELVSEGETPTWLKVVGGVLAAFAVYYLAVQFFG